MYISIYKMRAYIDGEWVAPNLAFFTYFTVMCCLYTHTLIQLAAQIGIIAYVIFPFLKKFVLTRSKLDNIRFYVLWFGAFTLLLYASKLWAYSINQGSKTMITVFRIFVIGFVLFLYVDSKKKAAAVMESYILACAIMGLVALVLSGENIGTINFGNVIGQHRNQIGAVAAPLVFICFYMERCFGMKYGKLLSAYFVILTFCTGSRSSILQMAVIYILCLLINTKNIAKLVRNLAIILVSLVIITFVIKNNSFLHDVVWVRMEEAIVTLTGEDVADASTMGRDYYKSIAYYMFTQRPFAGYGVDGFVCFLRDHPDFMGVELNAVYSHCNYAELAADWGILGLVVWYIPVILVIVKMFIIRKNNLWCTCMFCVFLSMVLFDYSRIPWETHLVMYLFFSVILLCRFERRTKKS